jgi:FMN phosphatase YigB (HAD superfamily)
LQARHGSLLWDVIFSGDTFNSYKPARAMYEGSSRLLGLEMSEICMVAAHIYDLRAAREFGMKTVYVKRSTEDEDVRDAIRAGGGGDVDAVVESFEELAGLF